MALSRTFSYRWCFFWYLSAAASVFATADDIDYENRPYEFAFNIVDFQHRYERKDEDGIINGEYGFVTADGVYHETGYATDKDGDFIITRMRNRKITSLKDARDIFKDRPEAAEKLVEAVARSCGSCKLATKESKKGTESTTKSPNTDRDAAPRKKMTAVLEEMTKVLVAKVKPENASPASEGKTLSRADSEITRVGRPVANDLPSVERATEILKEMIDSARKVLPKGEPDELGSGEAFVDDRALEKMANDLYYRFNYTISSHGHQEDGYRSGVKDGSYRAPNGNGVDTRVEYVSNEFGHQPNITLVPRSNETSEEGLKGYSFVWYWL